VTRLAIVHREGEVPLGQTSVAIVTCAPHRDAAFDAARYAIDETKARAPIWKAERFTDGKVWIGEPARSGPQEG
jgi:molybdopterin synthase catalytic subunit